MKKVVAAVALIILLITLVYFAPIGTGGDWNSFTMAIREWWGEGKTLYRVYETAPGVTGPYLYPPFATILMFPFAWLPQRLVWAMFVVFNQLIILALGRKYEIGLPKTVLLLLCPSSFYAVIFGQVDIAFMGLILLPEWLWAFAALVKPQLSIGLMAESVRSKRNLISTVGIFLLLGIVSLFFWGWPQQIAELSSGLINVPQNIARLIWPLGIPVGLILIGLGFWKKQPLLYLAGSPLLSPYATTGSLIGIALALAKYCKTYVFVIIWLLWWLFIVRGALA